MKRLLLLTLLLLPAGRAAAQSWGDLLKKIVTTVADNATNGQLTRYAIVGKWNYTAPGVKFEGEDTLADLGGAALESTVAEKLEKAYLLAGIVPGACSFAFEKEETFTATFGSRSLGGTYEFDPATHAIMLRFAKGKFDLGTVPGHAYLSGNELQLVFPVTKLVDMVTALGSKIPSLSAVTGLLEKYENVYIGFRFAK
ncbi:MAG: DUF4923 family protein [Alistipes sp.]|nr:DUF4923 family protein [Alistipes senegalensis]MCM1250929.1 DUF4923 family protein [Alistipes sp.]